MTAVLNPVLIVTAVTNPAPLVEIQATQATVQQQQSQQSGNSHHDDRLRQFDQQLDRTLIRIQVRLLSECPPFDPESGSIYLVNAQFFRWNNFFGSVTSAI